MRREKRKSLSPQPLFPLYPEPWLYVNRALDMCISQDKPVSGAANFFVSTCKTLPISGWGGPWNGWERGVRWGNKKLVLGVGENELVGSKSSWACDFVDPQDMGTFGFTSDFLTVRTVIVQLGVCYSPLWIYLHPSPLCSVHWEDDLNRCH